MAWIYLMIASFGEIVGVLMINFYIRNKTFSRLLLVMLSFLAGFFFLSLAVREIPLGTAYAIWTGLGTAGAVLLGMIVFHEPVDRKRIVFLSCIIIGAIGLRILE